MGAKDTKKTRSKTLKAGSMLTIENVGGLLSEVNKCLEKKQKVKILSDAIDNIDLSGIQFIISITSDPELNELVDFNLTFADSSKELLQKCGFNSLAE